MSTFPRCMLGCSLLFASSHAGAQAVTGPRASVVEVRGEVEVAGAARHAATTGETLERGQRIVTRANAAADLRVNGAMIHLGENTTLVLFAPATPPHAGQPVADDTTLVRGTVAVSVPTRGERSAVSFATRAAVAVIDAGDVVVLGTDGSGAMRVAVQQGSVRVRAAGRDLGVRAGSGLRVESGHPPGPPRPLPPAPTWSSPPQASVLSMGEPVDLSGVFAPGVGRGAGTPSRWHVQVARDEAFTDRLLDAIVPAQSTRFDVHQLASGQYFSRVAAIDADRFEGQFSAAARTVVAAPRVVPGGSGRRASVEIPPGFFCGLDGGPLLPSTGALWLLAARPHTVRCAATVDGRNAIEVPITAAQSGLVQHAIRIEPDDFDSLGGVRTVVLRLSDAGGMPLAYANVRATASDGAAIGTFREAAERGVYSATLQWRRGLNTLRLHFVVNDGPEFDERRGVVDDAPSTSTGSPIPTASSQP